MSVLPEIQNKFNILIEFSLGLIFKDSLEADKYETTESAIQSRRYIDAYLANDQGLVNAFRANTRINNENEVFREQNKYYRDLFIDSNIDMFLSRISDDFEIIGTKTVKNFSKEDEEKFKEFYNACLTYYKLVLYSSAFHDSIVDYRAFTRFFITFMTIERFMDWFTTGENINAQLDTNYGINQLLYSHGITFLDDLPDYYKRRTLYNLGYIIRNKGSAEAFTSIFEIFNLTDVKVFKYYLTKQYQDSINDYDIFFQKISFDEKSPLKYIESISSDEFYRTQEQYETVVRNDPSWQVTKDELKKLHFNFIASKYIDIESVRNLQKFSTDLAYFMALIYQIKELKDNLASMNYYLELFKNEEISFFHVIITLNACMMRYCGYEDTIVKDADQFEMLYMFNPDFDKRNLSEVFFSHFSSSAFVPLNQVTNILSMDSTRNIFEKNIDLRNQLLSLMDNETNIDKYWALQKDYNYLFMQNTMFTFFNGYNTYGDYLNDNSKPAFDFYQQFLISDRTQQRELLNELYTVIETLINSESINFGNRAFLITYLRKLISFFKSYTVDLRDLNFSFYIDGPLEKLKLLDKVEIILANMNKADFNNMTTQEQLQTVLHLWNNWGGIYKTTEEFNTFFDLIVYMYTTDKTFITSEIDRNDDIYINIVKEFAAFITPIDSHNLTDFADTFDTFMEKSIELLLTIKIKSDAENYIAQFQPLSIEIAGTTTASVEDGMFVTDNCVFEQLI